MPRPAPAARGLARRIAGSQGTGAQRIPGQGRQPQPPVSQPPMTQIPAPQGRRGPRMPGRPPAAGPAPQQPGQWQDHQDSQRIQPPDVPDAPGARTGRMRRPVPEAPLSNRLNPPSEANIAPVGPPSMGGMPPVGPGSRTNITPVGPGSRPGVNPVGPGSRGGMAPVGPPSRPSMTPAGRLATTAVVAPTTPPAPPRPETEPPQVGGPERREDIDPLSLTTEMEPISEAVEQKRTIDATLARFSAVHDEMAAEEAQRRSRRMKLMPWLGKDDDLEEALTSNGPVSPATASQPRLPKGQPQPRRRMPVNRPATKRDRRRRSMLSAKMAAIGVAVIVLAGSYFGWQALHHGPNGNQIQEVAALDENSPAILESQKQYGDSNFLLVGTSDRPGSNAGTAQPTDTIMVVHVPADGTRAAVVSFPPSLQVDRPVCQQWDNKTNQATGQVPAQTGVKLSSIYSVGGPRCVTDTVQQLSGLRINHFVGVDTAGFTSLVGSVQGGVQLCVAAPVQDAKLGTIVAKSGTVTLTGTKALDYVTADQVTGDKQPADLSRINRQQRFLAAALRKTIGQQNLLINTGLLNNFLGTFTKSTFGDNMGVDQLAKLATSLQGLALGRITFVTVPTTGTTNAAGEQTLQASTSKQLFNAIIDNAALPGETASNQPAATPTTAAVAPKSVKVQVINGIGDSAPGAATRTANSLKQFDFVISQIGGPAPPGVTHTEIRYASGQLAQAQLLASSVPSAKLQVDPSLDGAIQLVLGPGFDDVVKAPKAGAVTATGGSSEAPAGLSYVNAANTSCA
jgi:LCP family protein required for cell wall assembly